MSSLNRELVILILQFLEEEKFEACAHKLERESGCFFNMKYFEEKVHAGEWDEVENYLSGFTKIEDNRFSLKMFFEIRKQKYLEALDRNDKGKAVDILVKDLKVFSIFNDDLYKEITYLLTLENFRENTLLSKYADTKTARGAMIMEIKRLIESNPLFRDKLVFPTLKPARLRSLINQSLNWQHQLCRTPKSNPDIKTLFTDHSCPTSNGARAPIPAGAVAKPAPYVPLAQFYPPGGSTYSANGNPLAGWVPNSAASSTAIQSTVVAPSSMPIPPNQVSGLKRPKTPPNAFGMVDYRSPDREQLMKRVRIQPADEVMYPASHSQASWSQDDLPRTVARNIPQGSNVTSMDFHPTYSTLLLVGSANGEVTLWEVGMKERLASKPFHIWQMTTCSLQFQSSMVKDSSISINGITWSPDGHLMAVAYTKHLVHLYAFQAPNDFRQHLEIDAHVGNVNDLSFCHPHKQLCLVTCGDDKLVKVWNMAGHRLYNFEGHQTPVSSVLPHCRENIHFIFSTALDGKIKAWLYDEVGSRVDYDATGMWCTKMLYSSDGSRLFSCGTSTDGYPFLVEWNESDGAIKRKYTGFRKTSTGIVQFDTAKNHILAAGEDKQVKFWDMDNINVLASTDADGGLSNFPRLRFNKEGNLLAVTTENGFKVLANPAGLRSLRSMEIPSSEALKAAIEPPTAKVVGASVTENIILPMSKVDNLDRNSGAIISAIHDGAESTSRIVEKPISSEDVSGKAKPLELAEILDPVQCRAVTVPKSTDPASKVVRLLYTNSGSGILALSANGIQNLWKWVRNEQNPDGKATASIVPQLWISKSGTRMINDVSSVNLEEAVPCIALSSNDSYVMSATGGKVSLFNMMTFKVMTTTMEPPPASTYLAFHLADNNVIAIGMEDSTIDIYNVKINEVKEKLKGHEKRITGLAFSTNLNVLVSSGADIQLCAWDTETWEKKKTVTLQNPAGKVPLGDTGIQFHSDQIRLLVFHETQFAIYDASKMECLRQWVPQDILPAAISHAAYSCDSQLVYASFRDGNIGIFDAETLKLRCRIAPSAYISQAVSSNESAYPLVVARHPKEPNQFAVGLSDGAVKVLEPNESDGTWGVSAPPADNGGAPDGREASTSSSTSNSDTEQQHQQLPR